MKEKTTKWVNIVTFLPYISCEKGATAIEYVLIAAGIALAILAAVFAFGDDLSDLYDGLSTAIAGE